MNKQIQQLLLVILSSFIFHAAALISPAQQLQRSNRGVIVGSSSLQASAGVVVGIPEAPTRLQPVSLPEQQQKRRKNAERHQNDSPTDDLWEVRVYNDEVNTHEWVARCLVVVAGATEWQAYLTTKVAHQEGEAHLGLYEREIAEAYTQGLREQGIVVEMFPVGDFQ